MISIYELNSYSEQLRLMRKNLGFTIQDVSHATGINPSTIKQLENGKRIPRIDTIQILSSFYKCDLFALLSIKIKDFTTMQLLDDIRDHSSQGDVSALMQSISTISNHLESKKITPIEYKDLEQLKHYVEGLLFAAEPDRFTNQHEKACEKYIYALSLRNQTFSIGSFEYYKYSAIEMNILYSLAVSYGYLRQCDLSNKILLFVHNTIYQLRQYSDVNKVTLSKLYYNLSYNYHRLGDHENAYKYAVTGIEHCLKSDTSMMLALLLGRKGVALRKMHKDNWENPLLQGIALADIYDKQELKKQLEKVLMNN